MKWFIKPLEEIADYRYMLENIKSKNTPVLATGVIDVQKTQLIYSLCEELDCGALIITDSETSAKEIHENMEFFDDRAVYLPAKDFIFYSADVHSSDITRQRFMAMDKCIKCEARFVTATAEALFEKLMPKELLEKNIIELSAGDVIEPNELIKKLVYMGYERSESVEGVGQFAVRGGIVDIFSPVHDMPVRIEFWDDEVESDKDL